MPTNPAAAAHVADFLALANAQRGKAYVFGAHGPDSFDCSGLVIWDLTQLGYKGLPGDSDGLLAWCDANHGTIPLTAGATTPGALLFRRGKGVNGHVVISLGNGMTIEAKGKAYGVGSWSTSNRNFTDAALIPGMAYGAAGAAAVLSRGSSTPASSSGGGGSLDKITRVFTELADPKFWRRVGLVLLGIILVLVGAGIIKGDVWGYVPLVGGS